MLSIKFSHNYPKLYGQTSGELLSVKVLIAKEVQVNKVLLEYDTKYLGIKEEIKYYILPRSGKLVQLIFLGNMGIPFCTIRSMYNGKYNKLDYYRENIGQVFDFNIEKLVE